MTSMGELKCSEQGTHTFPNWGCIRHSYLYAPVKLLCRAAVTVIDGLSLRLSKTASFSVLKRTDWPSFSSYS